MVSNGNNPKPVPYFDNSFLQGIYVFIFGLMVTFFGALFFHAALIRINTYIKELEAFNSKTGREHRERPRWEEADPLLEEDEDDYYEKKRKDM